MNYYLNRFSVREQLITANPTQDVGIIVVIPCFNEPHLISSLGSLAKCNLPTCGVEVITVINAPETASKVILEQNKQTLIQSKKWCNENQQTKIKFYFLEENQLPVKDAGVGLARKIGMDEAVRRFETINNANGIILCFDADAKCDINYLVEVEKHFIKHPTTPACSIHFEHPVSGDEFSQEIYNGILQYELHLRVYKNGLKYCGLPYAFHTIGSSMAVRSIAYQKQNGMNKRKAGEDFYFLQKLIPLGNFTELKTTKIIPSPRVSDRVPFGTGKAMQNWLSEVLKINTEKSAQAISHPLYQEGQGVCNQKTQFLELILNENQPELLSFHLNSYIDLKQFCDNVADLYTNEITIPKAVQEFLSTIDFEENLLKIRKNSTSKNHFVKLFFNWFNAFKVLKYIHFARDNYYPNVPIFKGANELLLLLGEQEQPNLKVLLLKYREIDIS